jgi:tRNA(Ile)-lysidine synthase
MAARKARHEFLAQTAVRLKISRIALAHHAEDQVELFFLRLLRGAGSEGLTGMKWQSPSPANPKIQLLRPLLEHSKESLRDYAASQKIAVREDASNNSLDIQRNRIRRELLPLLRRAYQPALARTISRVMDILRAEFEFINDAAEEWLSQRAMGVSPMDLEESLRRDAQRKRPSQYNYNSRISFDQLPIAIQRRCVQSQLLRRGIPADFALVERLRNSPAKLFTLFPQIAVLRAADGRLHFRDSSITGSKTAQIRVDLAGRAGDIAFADRSIAWKLSPQKTLRVPRQNPRKELFDANKVGSPITLRHWQPGDRFQPIGMKQAVKLQDFFVNQKIPRARRHHLIVAVTARNEVFWVESLRISEQFKLTPQTTRRLTWQWKLG